MSFGHFIRAPILYICLIALATAIDPAIVTKNSLSIGTFGFRIIVAHIPPFGENHALPRRPTPPVCSSAIIIVPFNESGSSFRHKSFAIHVVEGVV